MQQIKSISVPFRLHVTTYGHGGQRVLAFHGFGQDGSVFQVFNNVIGSTHQLHSFDLPFHGKSQINLPREGIDINTFKDFFQDYFNTKKIASFILIGYSIGAKFALNLVKLFPDRIERIILIAPDGLKINFWYRLATCTSLSRALFRYFMDHPGFFFKLTRMLEVLKLIHPSVSRFVKSQVSDAENRNRIYDAWVNYRTLNMDIRELGKIIVKYKIPVELFLGAKDRLISADAIKPLIREFPDVQVYMLPVGHTRLVEDTAAFFEKEGF